MVLAADWQVGEVLWTLIWFTLLFIWIWLAIRRVRRAGGFSDSSGPQLVRGIAAPSAEQ
mgnify:CR=1 FL=1